MGKLKISFVNNTEVSKRNILIMPPEPPMKFLFNDPSNSIYIGRTKIFNVPFYWTPDVVANPHIVVVGVTGSGKSYFIKTFLLRNSYVWNTNALIIDWSGEYKEWVQESNGKIVSLGKGSYINLLDTGGMRPYDRIKQIMRSLGILTDIKQYPEQKRLTEEFIEHAYLENKYKLDRVEQKDELGNPITPPTLKDVVLLLQKYAKTSSYQFPAELENAIYRLKKLTKPGEDFFSRQSTVRLDKILNSGMVDIDLSGLPDEHFRALASLTILQFVKEKMRQRGYKNKKGLDLIVVLDEAWKIAQDENSDAVMLIREGRKYNFGLIVASQNPTDISDTILSNSGTAFVFRTSFMKYLDYLQTAIHFSNFMKDELTRLNVGQCAVHMMLSATTNYPSTFLLNKVEGEEPSKDYYVDLFNLVDKKMEGKYMSGTVSIGKDKLRHRLLSYGLNETKIDEICRMFEKNDKHLNVVQFVLKLQNYGVIRDNLSDLLKDMSVDDSTIINIFNAVDEAMSGSMGDVDDVTLKKR